MYLMKYLMKLNKKFPSFTIILNYKKKILSIFWPYQKKI